MDEKGRVHLKKKMREDVGIKLNFMVKVKVENKKVVIEPIDQTTTNFTEKYYGIVKVKRWPGNLEDFMGIVVRKGAKNKGYIDF